MSFICYTFNVAAAATTSNQTDVLQCTMPPQKVCRLSSQKVHYSIYVSQRAVCVCVCVCVCVHAERERERENALIEKLVLAVYYVSGHQK